MAERKKIVIPKRFVDKYGDKISLWSYSKVNTLDNCVHEYYLSRIKKIQGEENIYTLCGTISHDIIEGLYNDKITYEKMIDEFEEKFLDIEMSDDYKFSSDAERNTSMRKKYKDCVSHFFKHHEKINHKVATEKLIWIDVVGNIFMGYVDAIHKNNEGNFIITDWKTSTIYTGKDIKNHGKQLLLYALGLIQGGIDINKIKVRWNFLKYTNITYKLKNGKDKTTHGERNKWVEKIKTPLKKDIKEFYKLEDWEAEIKVNECMAKNSINDLDISIQNKYKLSDCYVYAEVKEESINELKQDLVNAIKEIKSKSDLEDDWTREPIDKSDEYYCNVLCGVKKHCKYYKDYLKNLEIKQVEEEDIIEDLSFLDDLEI